MPRYLTDIEVLTSTTPKLAVNIAIYPNPTASYLQIDIDPGQYELRLHSVNGQLVKSQILNTPQTQLSIADLPQGIYLLTIFNEKGILTEKIQVVR